ncbi:Nramp family divalent metal transporter [Clavibacter michiganensis]|uniref:Mn2+/Fe2+ transport protein, NRAMP family n=1 Tax=Clavibacter michiganensis subsp. michiganensis (strain NCPPB 382) TaxID=443906 RepID=A5CSS4_CLAM3|nr:Nramp family divalent metal transporter [Clavibacter michiganensis]MDO4032491.1 Nramp family divalent metal transporter [Clavibacter michiganensis]MDO4081817.1 Nramp family divalent metal transporter [Clavibacter michiganensis]MDO4087981.1 Nramp family divalent metal transporter [Clavibacter michiganensis]MDO4096520.1 Nramp family divalent metal transporter [Clavibacter michiganensis]MWJ04440.1 divalent metal cation transporter [Clavibacter michiganensis subsp. michiganensis]
MTDLDTRGDVREPQESAKRWRIVGPGLVVAATGIGAGDLVATLVAGSRFGYALLWAAVLGVIIKIFLVEGAGRYSLATGKTIFEGWRTVGRWTTWYFGPYILIWGLVYGAAAMSSSALPLAALFPGVDLKVFAIACGLVGAVVVWFGRYSAFEKIIAVFVGLMFVTVVGAAIVTVPNVPALLTGLVPTIPEGGLVVALSIAGGVGGTITLAAYGYWLREKGWVAPRWMKVMRIDNSVAYVMSGIFVLSMLVVGAELLYSADIALADGEGGLVQLADVLGERYGAFMTWFFLLGFFATSFSSILGVWNGVSLMFADFLGTVRGLDVEDPRRRLGGSYYRAFIVWLTIPPIGLLFLDQPIGLIIAYGVLGALFMPFLAITLLVLLNTDRTPRAWRNRPLSNTVMGLSALLFVVLGVQQLVTEVGKLL